MFKFKRIKRNKKGVSIAEIIAATAILGLAISTLSSAIYSSYKGTLRAEQYLLAEQISKTYTSMLSKEITKAKLASSSLENHPKASKTGDEYYYVTICDSSATAEQKQLFASLVNDSTTSYCYNALFNTSTDYLPLELNGQEYTCESVKIEIQVFNKSFGYYSLKTTVSYSGDREVTYDRTCFAQ